MAQKDVKPRLESRVIDRIRQLVDKSGRSRAEIGLAVNNDRSFVSGLLTRANPSVPNVVTMARLASELCVSLDFLMCLDDSISVSAGENASAFHAVSARLASDIAQSARRILIARGDRPTFEDVLSWHKQSGGVLTGSSRIENYIDLIEVPNASDQILRPYKIGPQSLAAETLSAPCPAALLKVVETMRAEQRDNLVQSYRAAFHRRSSHPIEDLRVTIPAARQDENFEVDYLAVRLPVKLPLQGRRSGPADFILSFCSPSGVA